MPWESPAGFENDAPSSQAFFLGYRCEEVDVFGQQTVKDVSFAVQAHANVSDKDGHFSQYFYAGLYHILALHTDNATLVSALEEHGIPVHNGSVKIAGLSSLDLEMTQGSVRIEFEQMAVTDSPERVDTTVMLLASANPVIGLHMTERTATPYVSASTTITANGDAKLAEWQLLRHGAPSNRPLFPNSTITIEVVTP